MMFYRLLVFYFFTILSNSLYAQCPPNIDFEQGNFNGWQCWTGTASAANGVNIITWDASSPGPPVDTRHSIISAALDNSLDTFGLFPKSCPNGSGYSIKLGNTKTRNEAEGVSYTFTIPAGQNKFNLIYYYAVVFEGPNHSQEDQPRLKISIENLTDAREIGCSSFSFTPDNGLPGFFLSANQSTGTAVLCKNWSANSINLDGNAGKTIRIFFTTADCTLNAHFGYAYIDLNTECSGSFVGAVYCPGDTVVNITAPFGYQNYEWYNKDFSQLLGNTQKLILSPIPALGDSIKVIVTPYSGYGCVDILTAALLDTLKAKANAGLDASICNLIPVQIGTPPLNDLVYKWSPATGLSNPDISNPIASPAAFTEYVLTVTTNGGGCVDTDNINVVQKTIDNTLSLIGNADYCIGTGTFPLLRVSNADSISWFRDSLAVSGAAQTAYTIKQSGNYFAQLFTKTCPLPVVTRKIKMTIDSAKIGIMYPVKNAVFNFPEQLQAREFGNNALWSPPISLDNPNTYSPIFRGLNQQLYFVQIKTASGCVTVDTQLVKPYKKIDIYVPAAFAPNGSSVNNKLRPLLFGFSKINYFKIYNRWGKLLFSTTNDQQGWDGKIENALLGMQTVVWIIEAVDVDGKVHNKQGSTILLR